MKMAPLWYLYISACFFLSNTLCAFPNTKFMLEEGLKGYLCYEFVRDQTMGIPSKLHCAAHCLKDKICVSFFYSHVTRKCQTHRRFLNSASGCMTDVSFQYYISGERKGPIAYPAKPGYIYDSTANMCYRVNDFPLLKWIDARVLCQQEGGDLIKLDTPVKLKVVQDIVSNDGLHEYFVGAKRYEDVTFHWVVDNSTVVGLDGHGNPGACLEIEPTLKLDPAKCEKHEQKFFCEIQL